MLIQEYLGEEVIEPLLLNINKISVSMIQWQSWNFCLIKKFKVWKNKHKKKLKQFNI